MEQDFAVVGSVDAREDLHQSRFAGPIFADDGQHLAGPHGQADAVQRQDAGEPLPQRADLE